MPNGSERPLHLVDKSRNKLMIKSNGTWTVDYHGEDLFHTHTFPQIQDLHPFIDLEDQEEALINMRKIMNLNDGKKKIMGQLSHDILLRNDLKIDKKKKLK